MEPIGYIRSPFPEKFGVPRQAGLTENTVSYVYFNPAYRVKEAFRGLEGFSHIWILWDFHKAHREKWSPTVRPPVLGGNVRVGVFATRSPFRPNPIGLSSVRLLAVVTDGPDAPYLKVAGADLMDGTPVWDIKPYLAYADAHPQAVDGFAAGGKKTLSVLFEGDTAALLLPQEEAALREVLAQDPRPAYQEDPDREYGFGFLSYNIKFKVLDGVALVTAVTRRKTWEEA